MRNVDIRDGIWELVSAIHPLDDIESQHINFVLDWIQSGVEIFRTEKPATPSIHLVSYFLVFSLEQSALFTFPDRVSVRREASDAANRKLTEKVNKAEQSKILLVDHKKAELWLPPGGHVELNEDPKDTVVREAKEELGIEAEFFFEKPLFVTVTKTVGNVTQHTDVSLWYALKWNSDDPLIYDKDEFNQIKWFGIDEIPFEKSDPHLRRFIKKMKESHIEL